MVVTAILVHKGDGKNWNLLLSRITVEEERFKAYFVVYYFNFLHCSIVIYCVLCIEKRMVIPINVCKYKYYNNTMNNSQHIEQIYENNNQLAFKIKAAIMLNVQCTGTLAIDTGLYILFWDNFYFTVRVDVLHFWLKYASKQAQIEHLFQISIAFV